MKHMGQSDGIQSPCSLGIIKSHGENMKASFCRGSVGTNQLNKEQVF